MSSVVLNACVMKLNILFQRKGNIVRADFIRVVLYAGFIVSPMGTGEMVLVMNRPNPAGAGHWRVLQRSGARTSTSRSAVHTATESVTGQAVITVAAAHVLVTTVPGCILSPCRLTSGSLRDP